MLVELPRRSLRQVVQPSTIERAPGVHVSQLVEAVMETIDPEKYGKEYARQDSENWQEAGFLWERVLSTIIGEALLQGNRLILRASELAKDGVTGTPDLLECDEAGMLFGESKFTWRSAKGFDLDLKKFIGWKMQTLAYAHLLDLRRCHFYVFFVNGDYGDYTPSFREYMVTYTDREVAENWRALTNMGRKRGWL